MLFDENKWLELGKELRTGADDAHDGETPDVFFAYSFMMENPECFGFDEWPDDMPDSPPFELICGYKGISADFETVEVAK